MKQTYKRVESWTFTSLANTSTGRSRYGDYSGLRFSAVYECVMYRSNYTLLSFMNTSISLLSFAPLVSSVHKTASAVAGLCVVGA